MQAQDFADLYALEESFWWFAGMREITAALLDPLCSPNQDRMILDAGCGTGGNLGWLRRYAGESGSVTGIDLVSDALNFCREGAHSRLAQASTTDLPFANSTFHLVTSFDVLGHLTGEGSDLRALREIHRVLRPKGIAFVRVAAYEWMKSEHDEAISTRRRYSLGAVVKKMQAAGFNILRETYANSLLLPLVALRRLVLKRLGLAARGSDVKPLSPQLQWLNSALIRVLQTEARWLRSSHKQLPAGLSAICIAVKPQQ